MTIYHTTQLSECKYVLTNVEADDFIFVQILQGNINTYIPELRDVEPPIIGRRIRFVPYSAHPRSVCVRVELYGCPWTGEPSS